MDSGTRSSTTTNNAGAVMTTECFRCGWCGQPTDCDGNVLTYDEAIAMSVDWGKATMTHGDCCPRDPNTSEPRIVTKEMAMDAQDPDLEGREY